jgi:hypothetical protein
MNLAKVNIEKAMHKVGISDQILVSFKEIK